MIATKQWVKNLLSKVLKKTVNNYSLEEQRIGTWIDGKPLYQKTIDFGSLPNASQKSVAHNIENADSIWINDGYVFNATTNTYYPLFLPSTEKAASSWYCNVDRTIVRFNVGSDRTAFNAIITLRYTKTTDTATI